MVRILYLTQVLPYPLNSGAKIRQYYVLRHLAPRHDVTLVSFVREDDRPEFLSHLAGICQAVHTVPMRRSLARNLRAAALSFLGQRSATILRDEISEMHTLLRYLVREEPYDVVHADQTSMAQYALYARDRAGGQPKLLLDAHNAMYRIPERLADGEANPLKRWLLRREARMLQRYERGAYAQFDHVVFVTDVDREVLGGQLLAQRSQAGQRDLPMTTIPICVDPSARTMVERVSHPRAVTHLGTMFWPPNIEGVLWFGREVWPLVRAQVPDARFVVIGKNPPQDVQNLALQEGIEVTGYVEDPVPYLTETAAFVVPLHSGGGMRVKIVDAWCWGMPIVSTTIGAEGIDVRDGENVLLADTPDQFARMVVRLLDEPSLGARLSHNGRRWVEERYNWRTVYGAWDAVYGYLADQGPPGSARPSRSEGTGPSYARSVPLS